MGLAAGAFPRNLEFAVEFMSSDRQGNPEPVSQHISMIQLPKQPLLGRVSDDRVGYFETSFVQLGLNDETGTPPTEAFSSLVPCRLYRSHDI